MDVIECEGAPRDLGWDWGRARASELRERCGAGFISRIAAGLRSQPEATRLALRDVRRQFPQQSEWLEGLARGAGIALADAAREMLAELAAAGALPPPVSIEGPAGLFIAAVLPSDARPRRCRPEGRFASLELARPAEPTALIGVNQAGLAAAVATGPSDAGDCAAPAALLVRDCLERFEFVEAALEWCLGRPAAGGAALILADAGGGVGGVELRGAQRRVLRATEGIAIAGSGAQALELGKSLRALSNEDLETGVGSVLGASARDALGVVLADPVRRGLRVPGGTGAWLEL